MKIQIKDKEVELKYSFRAMMVYEKIAGVAFNPTGISEILIYFYSTIISSDKELTLTFDDFIDWVDEHPDMLNEFSAWMTDIINRNQYINNKETVKEGDVDPKKE